MYEKDIILRYHIRYDAHGYDSGYISKMISKEEKHYEKLRQYGSGYDAPLTRIANQGRLSDLILVFFAFKKKKTLIFI